MKHGSSVSADRPGEPVRMSYPAITDAEFNKFRSLIRQIAGINLSPAKRALVVGRLGKRLRHCGLRTFSEYYRLVTHADHADERQMLVDLLTTNETYFFREPRHFEFLTRLASGHGQKNPLRVWSAACSSGEETYSIAMTLADALGLEGRWEVAGTDISSRMVERANRGLYPLTATQKIPGPLLKRYCRRGTREYAGTLLVDAALREKVRFTQMNLHGPWSGMGRFDVVFLRNVMIYFDIETKRRLADRLWNQLVEGGHLIIGHSETLNGVSERFRVIRPSIYRRD